MALPENRNKVDSHGPHSSRRQTRFHKKHIPRTRTCETNEGNHDPPDHVPASGALGYTFEECHGRQDLLPPFQRNWHKNHDWLWCSPYHHLVPTNTPCISRRHFRSCTFHNTCRSLCPWLFCTQNTCLHSPFLLPQCACSSQSRTLLGWRAPSCMLSQIGQSLAGASSPSSGANDCGDGCVRGVPVQWRVHVVAAVAAVHLDAEDSSSSSSSPSSTLFFVSLMHTFGCNSIASKMLANAMAT